MSFVNIIEWIKVDLDQLLLQFSPMLHKLSWKYFVKKTWFCFKISDFLWQNWYLSNHKLIQSFWNNFCYVILFLLCFILSCSIKQNQPFTLWIWFIFPTHLKGNFRWTQFFQFGIDFLWSEQIVNNDNFSISSFLKKRKLEKRRRRTRKLKLTEGGDEILTNPSKVCSFHKRINMLP